MKILMFGWEFPPFSHGGLGKACHGLTASLAKLGNEITFIVPMFPDCKNQGAIKVMSTAGAEKVKVKGVFSFLSPYETETAFYSEKLHRNYAQKRSLYGKNLFDEVDLFTEKAAMIASFEEFDIIHAHDWMTFGAGIRTKDIMKKPLVLHVHSTEMDRTGGNGVNQKIYDIERRSMEAADRVITVSRFEKCKIIEHYGIDASKISVAHNSINGYEYDNRSMNRAIKMNKHFKIVLFLGRVTLQKGPDYFLYAAKKVAKRRKDVIFVLAGSGDMTHNLIEKAAQLGIADKVFFTGYISDSEIERLMRSSDVLVMPSVAEPFGIVALEALINKVPLIVSKQSGVIEVVNHCIKVDFWDTDEMANKMLALLEYESLSSLIKENGFTDVHDMNWDNSAESCMRVYEKMLGDI